MLLGEIESKINPKDNPDLFYAYLGFRKMLFFFVKWAISPVLGRDFSLQFLR